VRFEHEDFEAVDTAVPSSKRLSDVRPLKKVNSAENRFQLQQGKDVAQLS